MRANQVRIGNWYNPESPMQIEAHDFINMHVNDLDLSPILLTEEWILKFGFSDKDYKPGYIGIDVGYTDFVLAKPNGNTESTYRNAYRFEFDYGGWPRLQMFTYVHELQNFFYAMYHQELIEK